MTVSITCTSSVRFILHTAILIAVVPLCSGCTGDTKGSGTTAGDSQTSVVSHDSKVTASGEAELTQQIKAFCGGCHAVPLPDSFPKHAWHDEVRRGFGFYYESGRNDLVPPLQSSVVSWYQQRAPEQLALPDQTEARASKLDFWLRYIDVSVDSPNLTAVSALRWANPEANPLRVWTSDMKRGVVVDCDLNEPAKSQAFRIGTNPAGTCSVDLDQNGSLDLVVADLGGLSSEDHRRGQVLWLRDEGGSAPGSAPRIILDSIGRAADVQNADFDNDGDQDLVVAEFGWHKTGGIHVLYNESDVTGERTFRDLKVDARPGTVHVPVTDLDGDGRLDFVALISQEHEVIEAFLNREYGFEKIRIYSAPDPSYGSSGIELTDFDHDGETDILYTVGDAFDSYLIKPYHGIWLLRNNGQMQFEPQHIADMPGVMRAVTADLDGDGDNDIIAAALLPLKSLRGTTPTDLQALIWMEQTADGQFERHVVARGLPIFVSVLVSDIDRDSDLDIVAGCYHSERVDPPSLLHVYENLRIIE